MKKKQRYVCPECEKICGTVQGLSLHMNAMTLEQQVTNLEISRKLKELGVKQESYFYHIHKNRWGVSHITSDTDDFISAFTVAELGEMLPMVIRKDDEPYGILYSTSDDTYAYKVGFSEIDWKKKYKVWYEDLVIDNAIIGFSDESEANARGKMLIYLLEHKLMRTP